MIWPFTWLAERRKRRSLSERSEALAVVFQSMKTLEHAAHVQISYLQEFESVKVAQICSDETSIHYLAGFFDASTCALPTRVREKVGPVAIEYGFRRLLDIRHGVPAEKVDKIIAKAIEAFSAEPLPKWVPRGGEDGSMLLLHNEPCTGLICIWSDPNKLEHPMSRDEAKLFFETITK